MLEQYYFSLQSPVLRSIYLCLSYSLSLNLLLLVIHDTIYV